jgi:hypothetical protein
MPLADALHEPDRGLHVNYNLALSGGGRIGVRIDTPSVCGISDPDKMFILNVLEAVNEFADNVPVESSHQRATVPELEQ